MVIEHWGDYSYCYINCEVTACTVQAEGIRAIPSGQKKRGGRRDEKFD